MEYSLEGGVEKTDYEISSASDSVNRLSGAVDISYAGNLLVITDAGNKRISIALINREENNCYIDHVSTVPCLDANDSPFTPNLVATDGEIIAVTSSDEKNTCIYLYHFGNEELFECYSLEEPATAIACVNGTCYYITENGYGKAEESFKTFSRQNNKPIALAANELGMLYVVDSKGCVQIYTEEEFILSEFTCDNEENLSFPKNISSLQADDEGNLYYISDCVLYKNKDELGKFDENTFVYGEIHEPAAFIINFQEKEAYFLYENFIVMTLLNNEC